MAATYGNISSSVKDFLVSKITGLDATTASVGDIDAVMDGLLGDANISIGLVVDFLYSVPHVGDSGRRANDLWDTFIGGLLIVQFTGRDNTETTKETLLNLLWRAFDGGSTKILTTGTVGSVEINVAGSGYSVDDVLSLVGGSNDCTVTVSSVGTAGEITGVSITNSGSLYSVDSYSTTVSPTGGSGATIIVKTISSVAETDRVSLIRIDKPEKASIGEFPYYFLPFTVKVNHGGRA